MVVLNASTETWVHLYQAVGVLRGGWTCTERWVHLYQAVKLQVDRLDVGQLALPDMGQVPRAIR
eukprot:646778-Rhodomonas_salina.2